jgi:Uma2 family endonuclease
MAMHVPPEPRMPRAGGPVAVRYELPGFSERWTISEQPVPESAWHDACVELIKALLVAWLRRTARQAAVYRNLAVRVRSDRPNVGFDPDVCLVEPRPPEGNELESLKLWRPDHAAPALVVEVVSPNHPYKDYTEVPEKCAAAGVGELVVFDPKLAGPGIGGGPHLLQLWRRLGEGFVRVHAGATPAFSQVIGAWWSAAGGGQRLIISDDAGGSEPWLTLEQEAHAAKEAERAAKEAERAAKEAERTAKEEALRRVEELEAELARRG